MIYIYIGKKDTLDRFAYIPLPLPDKKTHPVSVRESIKRVRLK